MTEQCKVCRWCSDRTVVRECDVRHERMGCPRLPRTVQKRCDEGHVHMFEYTRLLGEMGFWIDTGHVDGEFEPGVPIVVTEEEEVAPMAYAMPWKSTGLFGGGA